MKSCLISIKPKWCELIASGEKTIEVRKTAPKIETPFKCYIYCTKGGRPLVWGDRFNGGSFVTCFAQTFGYSIEEAEKIWDVFNGKVIGEFTCDDISEIHPNDDGYGVNQYIFDAPIATTLHGDLFNPVCDQTCLSFDEMKKYLGAKTGYSWHISDLKIYDEPKELSAFGLKRAPQSWCRVATVEEGERNE